MPHNTYFPYLFPRNNNFIIIVFHQVQKDSLGELTICSFSGPLIISLNRTCTFLCLLNLPVAFYKDKGIFLNHGHIIVFDFHMSHDFTFCFGFHVIINQPSLGYAYLKKMKCHSSTAYVTAANLPLNYNQE